MASLLSLLIADHRGVGLAEHLEGLSSEGLRVERSENLASSRSLLTRKPFDVVLLDPLARSGASELQHLWAAAAPPAPALLLVCEAGETGSALAAAATLREIPVDLVRRDAPGDEVVLRAQALAGRQRERDELDQLRYAASHDDRTRLLRPVPFAQRLAEHFSAASRHGLPLALALMDLDRFGAINKRFDHTVGDRVIAGVGSLVHDSLRAEDVGGRLGGDEFGLLLPYTSAVDAARVVRRVRDRMRELETAVDGSTPLVVTGSIGFESYAAGDLDSVEALRRHAERALRRAKEEGGDRAVYFRSLGAGSREAAGA